MLRFRRRSSATAPRRSFTEHERLRELSVVPAPNEHVQCESLPKLVELSDSSSVSRSASRKRVQVIIKCSVCYPDITFY